ncbi:MAG: TlpA family protein disulfide reductase [Polyangiales bacterium]
MRTMTTGKVDDRDSNAVNARDRARFARGLSWVALLASLLVGSTTACGGSSKGKGAKSAHSADDDDDGDKKKKGDDDDDDGDKKKKKGDDDDDGEKKKKGDDDDGGSKSKGAPKGGAHGLIRKKAPAFSLKKFKGGKFESSSADGKVLIVDFWATWCGPCKASFPKVDALYRKYKAKGVVVIGVNEDEDGGDIAGFVDDTGATFPIALDKNQKVAESFGVEAMPSTILIDKSGVVRFVHDGSHGDEDKEIEKEIKKLLADDGGSEE